MIYVPSWGGNDVQYNIEVASMENFYKNNPNSRVWWLAKDECDFDEFLFSFDKKKIYNLYEDYGHNMTDEEMEILNEDEPEMARLVSWRIGVDIPEPPAGPSGFDPETIKKFKEIGMDEY